MRGVVFVLCLAWAVMGSQPNDKIENTVEVMVEDLDLYFAGVAQALRDEAAVPTVCQTAGQTEVTMDQVEEEELVDLDNEEEGFVALDIDERSVEIKEAGSADLEEEGRSIDIELSSELSSEGIQPESNSSDSESIGSSEVQEEDANFDQQEQEFESDDDGEWPDEQPLMTGEAALNNLLDNNCQEALLLQILQHSLYQSDLITFQTACAACFQQYNPDSLPFISLLEATINMSGGNAGFFEALLEGQCGKDGMGVVVMEYLPNLGQAFLKPALRICGALIPRHAIDVWKAELPMDGEDDGLVDPGIEQGEIVVVSQMNWDAIGGVTDDLHTYISWPYKANTKPLNRLVGIYAEYATTGEGTMTFLHQTQKPGLLIATDSNKGESISMLGMCTETPMDSHALVTAKDARSLHVALNMELYNSQNRMRCAAAVLDSDNNVFVERIQDGGPMLLVYRSGDLIHPQGLQTHRVNTVFPIDAAVWAQPAPLLFFPHSSQHTLSLLPGDILVLVPPHLQSIISELDLRGHMYAADRECLPEVVAGVLRTLHIKTKQHVSLAAAIII